MLTWMVRVMLAIALILTGCLVLVAAQGIATMRDMSVSLHQTQSQHEQMLTDHQAQMRQLSC